MPASFEEIYGNVDAIIQTTNVDNKSTLSQVVLRHCFRTVKEATDCLLVLVEAIPLEGNVSSEYVQFIQSVGDLLSDLNLNIRHRGAFSAAHSSFSRLCKYMSSCPVKELEGTLDRWLDSFLRHITSKGISVTRRSAGLPLAILAVLGASPDTGKMLKRVVHTLFEVINQKPEDSMDSQYDMSQVHALNILKALIQDSNLTLFMREYVGKSFIVCISQFHSGYFPIKNCAGMLFSALVEKTFGRKSRNEEMVNRINARDFFGRYPELYHVLLKEMSDAVTMLANGKLHPLLYPILNILGRLKPSSMETTDTLFTLNPFIELTKKCSSAKLWKVREISGWTLAAIIEPRTVLSHAEDLTSELATASTNHAHGIGLQLYSLLTTHWKVIQEIEVSRLNAIISTSLLLLKKGEFILGGSAYFPALIQLLEEFKIQEYGICILYRFSID